MLYIAFIACAAAIAFGVTELLANVALAGVVFGGTKLGLAGPLGVAIALLSCFHRQGQGVDLEAVILWGSLASLAVIDLRSGYVPNLGLLPLMAVAIFHVVRGGDNFSGAFGALLVGGLALALHVLGKGASFGLGDVKLLALLGFILGAERSLTLLGDAFIIGAVIGLTLLALGRVSRRDALPFVPMIGLSLLWQVATHAL
ncbi:MAG: prepilin peptidase [Candidatus Baltobacteraceae bacterium]